MQEDTTADPVVADIRNFYKVELWTRDDYIECMLYAGRSLNTARDVFTDYARCRPAVAADDPATDARAHAMAEE
jgi:hypothetical protein